MLRCLLLTAALLSSPASGRTPPIADAPLGVAGFVGQATQGPVDEPVLITSASDFDLTFGTSTTGLANPYLRASVAAFFLEGGTRAWVVRAADTTEAALIGIDGRIPGARTGLAALLDVDEISIVAVPGATSPAVQTAMIAHCETAGDRLAILDPVPGADVGTVLAQRAGLGSDEGFAALYHPWIVAAPLDEEQTLPPSGFVAGIHAATSPHRSPVGPITTAVDVATPLTSADTELLNPEGVNSIRFFSGDGVRVWGARTIADSPEWIYVSVRRTALHLHESVVEGTTWVIDEPNDPVLWSTLETTIDVYLETKWREGWFRGATPDESWFAKVDGETMNQQDLLAGRTVALYGFAHLRPAEFMVEQVVHQRSTTTAAPSGARARPRLLPATPNPFNPRTTIAFELPRTGRVELSVHDAAGRRVRALRRGVFVPAGRHSVTWDGRDDTGTAVASGVYHVRLEAGGRVEARRVTLSK